MGFLTTFIFTCNYFWNLNLNLNLVWSQNIQGQLEHDYGNEYTTFPNLIRIPCLALAIKL